MHIWRLIMASAKRATGWSLIKITKIKKYFKPPKICQIWRRLHNKIMGCILILGSRVSKILKESEALSRIGYP